MGFTVAGAMLDACVLGALSMGPAYGYDLTQKTQSRLGVSESALYPVLRRLLKEGLLETYDEPYDGRNRRYYRLTAGGGTALAEYRSVWRRYKNDVEFFLDGGN